MKKLKFLLFLSFISFLACNLYAQERKTLNTQLDGGTLTFQYYEKDGVKIPDGPMEFKKANYIEKGECKDGYREGLWIATSGDKAATITAEYNYKNGMLEGITSFKNSGKDKYSRKLYPEGTYNFSKGRLLGENRIVHESDTIYCNFGEKGRRIGTWKIINPEKIIVVEYDDNSELKEAYELDVLGQKTQTDILPQSLTMALLWFNNYFQEIPFVLRNKRRPKLPTLCENKYGYIGPLEKSEN